MLMTEDALRWDVVQRGINWWEFVRGPEYRSWRSSWVTAAVASELTPEAFTERVRAGTRMAEVALLDKLTVAYAEALRSVAADVARRFTVKTTRLTAAGNPYHEPGGTPVGGRFAHRPGGPEWKDTPQQEAMLKQSARARATRELYPQGTRVFSHKGDRVPVKFGTVVRHIPTGDSQGGHVRVRFDDGQEGVMRPITLGREDTLVAAADPNREPKFIPPDPNELVPKAKLAEEIEKRTRKIREQIVAVTVGEVMATAGVSFEVGGIFDRRILKQVGVRARDADKSTRDAIRVVIDNAQSEGWTVPETAAAIKEHIVGLSDSTATMLARTDLIGTSNASADAAAHMVFEGQNIVKQWTTADDERVRPTHQDAEGQTVAMAHQFRVGDALLDYPGDPSGPDEEVIQCRCVALYLSGEPVTASVWRSLTAAFNPSQPREPKGVPVGGRWARKGPLWDNSAVRAEVESAAQGWQRGLTQEQRTALNIYTQTGYIDMNAVLQGKPLPEEGWFRGDQSHYPQAAAYTATVVDAVQDQRLPSYTPEMYRNASIGDQNELNQRTAAASARIRAGGPGTYTTADVHLAERVATADFLREKFPPGTVIQTSQGGLQSFSLNPGFTRDYNRSTSRAVVRVVKPRRGAFIGDLAKVKGESEVLVPPDQHYVVRDVSVGTMPSYKSAPEGGGSYEQEPTVIVTVEEYP